jgi:hypothetical protein
VLSIISVALPDTFDANSEIMIGLFYGFNLLGLCVLLYLFKNGVAKLNPDFGKSTKDLSSTGGSRGGRKTTEAPSRHLVDDDTTSSSASKSKGHGKDKKSWWASKTKDSSSDAASKEDEFGSTADATASGAQLAINTSDIELAAVPVKDAVPKWGEIAAISPRDKPAEITTEMPQSPANSTANSNPLSPQHDKASLFKTAAMSSDSNTELAAPVAVTVESKTESEKKAE